MRRTWRFKCLLIASQLLCAASAAEPDWGEYGRFLGRNLSQRTVSGIRLSWLNYSGAKNDPAYAGIVRQVADFQKKNLETRAEQLAFYINAYNILAIRTVLEHWPIQSIKDAGSFLKPVWTRVAGEVGGEAVSLDEIEERLRRQAEPRIHMAIVCASKSCPDLRREPYRAATLNDQLDAASRAFLDNSSKGLREEVGQIRISKIFAWFAEDFAKAGGVAAFVAAHRRGLPSGMPVTPDLPYDWTLNGE